MFCHSKLSVIANLTSAKMIDDIGPAASYKSSATAKYPFEHHDAGHDANA